MIGSLILIGSFIDPIKFVPPPESRRVPKLFSSALWLYEFKFQMVSGYSTLVQFQSGTRKLVLYPITLEVAHIEFAHIVYIAVLLYCLFRGVQTILPKEPNYMGTKNSSIQNVYKNFGPRNQILFRNHRSGPPCCTV